MGTFTHVIQLPPLTDSMMLVGAYRALMTTIGINVDVLSNYPAASGVTHPVDEAMKKLEADFRDTYNMLMASYMLHGGLTVTNMRFMQNCCIFTFSHPD